MMNYLTRDLVNLRLALKHRQSYRLIPMRYTCRNGLISSDLLLEMLNRSRVNQPVLEHIPSDLVSLDTLAQRLAPTGITRPQLFRWANRKRDPLPHIRFNGHTRRFSLSLCDAWLAGGKR